MILFLLDYNQNRQNLSIDEYFTVGDLQEACLIKYSLQDEDIDYIYFYSETKIIILGTNELKYNDTVQEMINKYDIYNYKLYVKKYYRIDTIDRLTFNDAVNETLRRYIYSNFQLYLQERNDRLIAESFHNSSIQDNEQQQESEQEQESDEEHLETHNRMPTEYIQSDYEDNISDFTSDYSENQDENKNNDSENNIDENNISEDDDDDSAFNSPENTQVLRFQNRPIRQQRYTRVPILEVSDPSSDSENQEENQESVSSVTELKNDYTTEYNNRSSITNISSNYSYTRNPYSENEIVIERGIRPIRSVQPPINSLNTTSRFISNYPRRHSYIPLPNITRTNMQQRRALFNQRIQNIENRYGISLNGNINEQGLRNESADTVSGLINLMNRTIGLIAIHDVLREFNNDNLNNTFTDISRNIPIQTDIPNTVNRDIRNMVEQIAQDDDSNQHVLIDTPDDVKILMSRDEFNEMKTESYIDYIRRTRPESISITNDEEENVVIDDVDMCSICSDDFTIISTIIDLPKCNHIFHRRCIGRWLTEFKNKCPLCNTDVSDNPIHV